MEALHECFVEFVCNHLVGSGSIVLTLPLVSVPPQRVVFKDPPLEVNESNVAVSVNEEESFRLDVEKLPVAAVSIIASTDTVARRS